MHQSRVSIYGFLGAVVLAGCSGGVLAGQRVIAEDAPIEWVEIVVHMADGRVLVMKEPRFPSRSRVLITTGKLPAFKVSGGSVASSSEPSSVVEELDSEVEDVVDTELSESGETLGMVEIAVEDVGVEEDSGPVTTFKKSSGH